MQNIQESGANSEYFAFDWAMKYMALTFLICKKSATMKRLLKFLVHPTSSRSYYFSWSQPSGDRHRVRDIHLNSAPVQIFNTCSVWV
jgi:hypothetical protein